MLGMDVPTLTTAAEPTSSSIASAFSLWSTSSSFRPMATPLPGRQSPAMQWPSSPLIDANDAAAEEAPSAHSSPMDGSGNDEYRQTIEPKPATTPAQQRFKEALAEAQRMRLAAMELVQDAGDAVKAAAAI